MAHREGLPPAETAQSAISELYRSMLRIRLFEEKVGELLESHEIKTATHLYVGQEAVAAGVCMALNKADHIWGNHRSHGHYLAKGGRMDLLMAELFCKETGCSRGRGGSMHLFGADIGVLGTVPMVGATIPIAVGDALSAVTLNEDRVSVAFFGDGATEEGVFNESLNFAALRNLPVIFACENNLFSSHLPIAARRKNPDLYQYAASYGIPSLPVDGNDAVAVYRAASQAVTRARNGEGPTFLEFKTYRWRGHVGPSYDLNIGIREESELREWQRKCPIQALERQMLSNGIWTEEELAEVRADANRELAAALLFAHNSPSPAKEGVLRHVFAAEGAV